MLVIGVGQLPEESGGSGPSFSRVGRDAGLVTVPGEDVGALWTAVLAAAAEAPRLEGVVFPAVPVSAWPPFEESIRYAFARGGSGALVLAYGPSQVPCVLVPAEQVARIGPVEGRSFEDAARALLGRLVVEPPASTSPERVVGAALVKNECDIIEQFVRHNLGLLEAMFVVDNGSSDGTWEILQALEREGLPVSSVSVPSIGYEQSELMTQCARWASERFAPDWIIPLDADEFLLEESPNALRRGLAGGGLVRSLPWRGYVPTSDDPLAESGAFRPRTIEPHQHFKVVVRAEVLTRARIATGNHWVVDATGWPVTGGIPAGVVLAHLPVRSGAQTIQKILQGSSRVRLKPRVGAGEAPHWLEYAELIRSLGGRLPLDRAQDMALRYASFPGDPAAEIDWRATPLPPLPACCHEGLRDPHNPLSYDSLVQDCLRVIEELRGRLAAVEGAEV